MVWSLLGTDVMSKWLLLLSLVITSKTALADTEENGSYISAGVAVGAGYTVDWLYAGGEVEGGYALNERWLVHGELGAIVRAGYGTTSNLTLVRPQAPTYEARTGLEAHGCHSIAVCGYAGADVGFRSSTGKDNNTGTGKGIVFVPRAGLDIALGGHLRFRPGVELRFTNAPADSEVPIAPGLGVTTEFSYRF